MRSKSGPQSSAEEQVREIRRQTRKRYSSEEKIRIVLEGLRGEETITPDDFPPLQRSAEGISMAAE